MLEMLIFIVGLYTLVFGRLRLPGNLDLRGWRARVAALFLIAPLPLAILLGRVIGWGLTPEQGRSVFGITELILVAMGVGGALIFGLLSRPREEYGEDVSTDHHDR
ncbi:MAG TPA: hypothetical protein VIK64_01015 [Anaerolineales bacterium]|jgi:hypothetical protein